jgi:hypothetical protein
VLIKKEIPSSSQMDTAVIDLRRCPCPHHYQITQVTFGDLHANAIKFIYNLIRNGICAPVSDASYDEQLKLYEYTQPLTKAGFDAFNQWIDAHLQVIDTTIMVRLIGDVLADRGRNDWFVLKIFAALKHAGVCVRTVLSNHDCMFLDAMGFNGEARMREVPRALEINLQGNANLELMYAIQDGVILFDEVNQLVHDAYLPTLVMLDYSLSHDGKLTIMTHAPVDLRMIEELAEAFDVIYEGPEIDGLVRTIKAINQAFQRIVHEGRTEEILIPGTVVFNALWTREPDLYQARGNRDTQNIPNITFVYGHDKQRTHVSANVIRLDNHIGKGNLEANDEINIGYMSNDPWPALDM